MSGHEWVWAAWLIIASAVTVASIIVKLTPAKWDDELLSKIKAALDFIALTPKKPE